MKKMSEMNDAQLRVPFDDSELLVLVYSLPFQYVLDNSSSSELMKAKSDFAKE